MTKNNQRAFESSTPTGPSPGKLLCCLLTVYAAACFLFVTQDTARAGPVVTGPNSTDSVIRTDGSAAYVLSSGASQITVVDTATDTVQFTIALTGLPPNTAVDIDWNESLQRLMVGCNNGQILSVDPALSTVVTLVNIPGNNYSKICAENWTTANTFGWAIDSTTGWLHQILTTGTAVPAAAMPIGTSVELIEKTWDPTATTIMDGYLLAVGTGTGGFVTVDVFDRSVFLSSPLMSWVTLPATPTGITTSGGAEAYVSANGAGGLPGFLLKLDLTLMAFAPAPIATHALDMAMDVSMEGQWISLLTSNAPGAGAKINVYDAGDPLNVLPAGWLVTSTSINPAGGLDTWLGGGGSIDDLYTIYTNQGADGSSQNLGGNKTSWTDATPGVCGANGFTPIITATEPGGINQEALVCADCPPERTAGNGGLSMPGSREGAHSASTPRSVQYSTGEEVQTLPVLHVPGVGIDLDISLTYRSRRDYDYRYGRGWFLNHDVRLRNDASGDKTFLNGHGRLDTYVLQAGGGYISPVHYDTILGVATTTTITDRFGRVSTFNAAGYRTKLADRYGNTIQYTWLSDQLTGITDTLGRAYSLSYDATGRLSSIVDFGGRTWTMYYDYFGQLRRVRTPTSTQFPSGRDYWYSYSGNNAQIPLQSNLVNVWTPKGPVAQRLYYDIWDRVYQEDLGPGSYTFNYDAVNSITTIVNRSGNTTKYTFGAFAMVTKVEEFTKGLRVGEPTSFVTTYALGSHGLPVKKVLPRGNRVDYAYDAKLNLTSLTAKETDTNSSNPTDIVWGYQYSVTYSQVNQVTDPRGNVTTMTIDGSGNTTQITRPTVTNPATQAITETFTHDGMGRMTSATDGAGRAVSFAFYTTGPQAGYLKDVTRDPAGLALKTTFAHDQYGNATSVTDPRGNTATITVDAENYVTEVQAPSPLNYRRRYTYDLDRNLTDAEIENLDRKGVLDPTTPWIKTTRTFNELGWILSATRPLTSSTSATTSYEYDGSGLITKVIQPEGNEVTLEYDERLMLFKATRAPGTADATTIRRDYGLNGEILTFTDGRGNATSFVHDLFDRMTKTTNALGHYVDRAYDKSSNTTTVKAYDLGSVLLAKSTRTFDEIDRMWKVTADRFGLGLTASFPTTTLTRDKGHLVTQVLDPLGNATTQTYDAAGRLLTSLDAALNKVTYTYDAGSNVTSVDELEVPTTGLNETFRTEFVYDVLNRRTSVKEIDRITPTNILTTTFEFDSRSNLTFRTDAEGHPVRWSYDLASRLKTYERALTVGAQIDTFLTQITESFDYDSNHRLVKITDDNFNATDYVYDALNRRTKTTHADSKFISWTYDKSSNVAGWTDQNGTNVTNTLDVLDRLVSRSITRGTGVLGTTQESYTYDGLDRLLTAVDNDYQVQLTHDSVSNVLRERQGYTAVGQEKWKDVLTSFTDAGSLGGINYPSAYNFTHQRDAIYRQTAIYDVTGAANVATFTWQGQGRLKQTNNQNGTVTEYAYDGFRRTKTIDHILSGGGSLHKFEYLYDKVHNRRMEKNSFSTTWIATLPAAVQTFLNGRSGKGDVYAYDMAYRMVDARYDVASPATEVASPGSQAFAKLVQYTIDGLGNRSQVQTTPPTPPTAVTYAVDVVNQYTTLGGVSRVHDSNGNLTDDGTNTYVYDYKNRLVEVKLKSSGASIATYKYDALGRRVEKAVAAGATTRYILSGQQVIEEYDGADVWQAAYIYEDGIDSPRAMDRADVADVNGNANTTEVLRFHYHQNALSSTSEMSQPTGAVVEWVSYDVYGLATVRDKNGAVVASSAVGNPYLYTGREFDAESGKYFYRARTYDPVAGRFLQRDPLGYVDGLGLHEYVRSAPSVWTDPLGLEGGKERKARVAYERAMAAAERAKASADRARDKAEALAWAVQNQRDYIDRHLARQGRSPCADTWWRQLRRMTAWLQMLLDQLDAAEAAAASAQEDAEIAEIVAFQAAIAYHDIMFRKRKMRILTGPNTRSLAYFLEENWEWYKDEVTSPEAWAQGLVNAALVAGPGFGRAGTPANLNPAQLRNYNRMVKRLPNGVEAPTIRLGDGGGVTFSGVVPGQVAGSSATYVKTVNSSGATTRLIKTTRAPGGGVVHHKAKPINGKRP